jgi:ADP-ribosylglycohydrolase
MIMPLQVPFSSEFRVTFVAFEWSSRGSEDIVRLETTRPGASTKRVIGGVRKGIRPENASQSPLSKGTVLRVCVT